MMVGWCHARHHHHRRYKTRAHLEDSTPTPLFLSHPIHFKLNLHFSNFSHLHILTFYLYKKFSLSLIPFSLFSFIFFTCSFSCKKTSIYLREIRINQCEWKFMRRGEDMNGFPPLPSLPTFNLAGIWVRIVLIFHIF